MLVTRTPRRAPDLVNALHREGAEAIVVPLIATQPLATPDEVARHATRLAASPAPRWVAFTSATAVRLVLGVASEALGDVSVAAVGSETAAALKAAGAPADLVAVESDAGGLARALEDRGVAGATVWFPSAEGASSVLPDGLRAAGAHVDVQTLYRSVMPEDAPRRLAAALQRPLDAVTLTSGSTARNLVAALRGRMLPPATVVVCIGRQTAAAARAGGVAVTAVADEPSAAGIVAALVRAFAGAAGATGPAGGGC